MSNKLPIPDYLLPPTSITDYQLRQTKGSLPITVSSITHSLHYKYFNPFPTVHPASGSLTIVRLFKKKQPEVIRFANGRNGSSFTDRTNRSAHK
jgi:hypothetical protein